MNSVQNLLYLFTLQDLIENPKIRYHNSDLVIPKNQTRLSTGFSSTCQLLSLDLAELVQRVQYLKETHSTLGSFNNIQQTPILPHHATCNKTLEFPRFTQYITEVIASQNRFLNQHTIGQSDPEKIFARYCH